MLASASRRASTAARARACRRWPDASERALLAAGLAARVADEVEHARVGALDALDERQRLEQLREAVGVQDDGDEVRPTAHVALAQQPG